MKKLLLLLPLLLGYVVTPTAQAVDSFHYEDGYKACVREYFSLGMTRQKWSQLSSKEKDG